MEFAWILPGMYTQKPLRKCYAGLHQPLSKYFCFSLTKRSTIWFLLCRTSFAKYELTSNATLRSCYIWWVIFVSYKIPSFLIWMILLFFLLLLVLLLLNQELFTTKQITPINIYQPQQRLGLNHNYKSDSDNKSSPTSSTRNALGKVLWSSV